MKKFIIIVLSVLIVGCAAGNMCKNIPEGSYSVICNVSQHIGCEPEDIANVLKIANVAGLASDKYTAAQAKEFIEDIHAYLERCQRTFGVLYPTLVKFLKDKYAQLPASVQIAIVLAEQMLNVDVSQVPGGDKVLSDYDYQKLYEHLDKQRLIVAPFLSG